MIKSLLVASLIAGTIGAPLFEANSDSKVTLDLATSSVGVDLRALLKDDTPFDNLPSLSTSKTNDFRYLGSVPSKGALYCYAVTKNKKDSYSLNADIGTALNDDGTITPVNYSSIATLVNSYQNGVYYFVKSVIKTGYTYNVGDKHRFDVLKFDDYSCDDDLSWQDVASGDNAIYGYYHDNYVVVDSKKASLCIVPFYDSTNRVAMSGDDIMVTKFPNAGKELYYCFFNLGDSSSTHDLSHCVGVDYSYNSYSYDYYVRERSTYPSGKRYFGVYLGTDSIFVNPKNASGTIANSNDDLECYERGVVDGTLTNPINCGLKHVEPSSTTFEKPSNVSSFFGWFADITSVKCTYPSLVDLDSSSISALGDKAMQKYFTDEKENYTHAFLIDSSVREVTSASDSFNNPNDFFNRVGKVVTSCHGVSSIQVFKLTFKDGSYTFDLNAIDSPVDVTDFYPLYDAQKIHSFQIYWHDEGDTSNWWSDFLTKLEEISISVASVLVCLGVCWIGFKVANSISRNKEKKSD